MRVVPRHIGLHWRCPPPSELTRHSSTSSAIYAGEFRGEVGRISPATITNCVGILSELKSILLSHGRELQDCCGLPVQIDPQHALDRDEHVWFARCRRRALAATPLPAAGRSLPYWEPGRPVAASLTLISSSRASSLKSSSFNDRAGTPSAMASTILRIGRPMRASSASSVDRWFAWFCLPDEL
jgi:hypothetical protein